MPEQPGGPFQPQDAFHENKSNSAVPEGIRHDDHAAAPASKADQQGMPWSGAGLDGVGYWQVLWLYLSSLLRLGEVYEMAGSHEDAVHAFREGQELVGVLCACSQIVSNCAGECFLS